MAWREYWKGKKHERKRLCSDFMGIDSFYIFEDISCYARNREGFFAFNNYDKNHERRLEVRVTDQEFCFNVDDEFGLKAMLLEDGFHVSTFHTHFNSSVGYPISIMRSSYTIPVEKQACGHRAFFRCPKQDCKRRMRKLYYERGKFLCRKCLNLGYQSQNIYPKYRMSKFSYEEKIAMWNCAMNDNTCKGAKALFQIMLMRGMMSQDEYSEYDAMGWNDKDNQ